MRRRIIGNDERAFKGVFIPAHLWLDEDLSPMELLLMTEIDSLDKQNGCHANNKHFANFLGLTTSRISQMVNDLAKRGHLTLSYERNGKQFVSRSIKVVNKLNTPIENSKGGYLENADDPSQNSKGGYLENCEESNTSLVNQDSNTDRVLEDDDDTGAREPKKDDQPAELESFSLWEQNWGFPSSIVREDLTDWINEFGDELVTWAIKAALRRDVAAKNADCYLFRTFNNMRQLGITSVAEAEEQAERHRQQVSRERKGRQPQHYGRHGRAKRVEQLPDWAKGHDQDSNNHHEEDSSSAANAKATPEQLAETQRLLAQLREKHKRRQQEQADQEEQRVQQKRDEGREKNGLADLLHSNG